MNVDDQKKSEVLVEVKDNSEDNVEGQEKI